MWGSSAIVCLPYPNKFGHESTSEEEGWDGVFLEEYFTYWGAQGITYDPWLALTSMALRTRRVSLGTTVTPLPSRLPWKLAREAITLDHLSHGRLILGVGLGDAQDRQFGKEIDVKTRASLLRAFDLLKRFVR
jgi:alkanesulfonate monooxygenase SsuD/methylene tetrahydromethanopterin reductase-like flavin-dependent oxidoreductase (luciferase family)